MTVEILNTNLGDTRGISGVTDSPETLGDTRPSPGVVVSRPEYEPTTETPGGKDRGENPKGFSPTPTPAQALHALVEALYDVATFAEQSPPFTTGQVMVEAEHGNFKAGQAMARLNANWMAARRLKDWDRMRCLEAEAELVTEAILWESN